MIILTTGLLVVIVLLLLVLVAANDRALYLLLLGIRTTVALGVIGGTLALLAWLVSQHAVPR